MGEVVCMEKYFRYDEELVKRFVNDYKLPIVMLKDKYFFYYLGWYEKEFNSFTKWKNLWHVIDERFEGDAKKFLKEYYDVRENVIVTISESEAYQKFNNMDMSVFALKDKPEVTSNNIYNCNNIGKAFLSIDLRKANFQALRYVDREILLGADTYEEFISKFTDLDYIKDSKYFRSVVFGKLNPKRHITVEKYLINEVWKVYEDIWNWGKIVSLSNDEIVIELDLQSLSYSKLMINKFTDDIKDTIKERLDLDVRVEYFTLDGYRLQSKETGEFRDPFFVKTDLSSMKIKFTCLPDTYRAIVENLYDNMKPCEEDYHFMHEGIDCRYMEEFDLTKIKG